MPKYPLKPLLEHREHRVAAATEELGKAVRGRESAEDARLLAEANRRDAEAKAAAVRADEAALLAGGELRAVNLARGQAWEVSAQAQIDELSRAETTAEQRAAEAARAVGVARAELARKTADHDVVLKDKGRFDESEKRRALAMEEEAMAEVFGANANAARRP